MCYSVAANRRRPSKWRGELPGGEVAGDETAVVASGASVDGGGPHPLARRSKSLTVSGGWGGRSGDAANGGTCGGRRYRPQRSSKGGPADVFCAGDGRAIKRGGAGVGLRVGPRSYLAAVTDIERGGTVVAGEQHAQSVVLLHPSTRGSPHIIFRRGVMAVNLIGIFTAQLPQLPPASVGETCPQSASSSAPGGCRETLEEVACDFHRH